MVLTPEEIRALIFCRLEVVTNSCNSFHRGRVFGQIQGLLYALNSKIVDINDRTPVATILAVAGIPYTEQDGLLVTPDDWMRDHGFSPDGNGGYGNHHPRFSGSW